MVKTEFNEIPETFYHLDDDGDFSTTIKTNQKLEISQYWANHSQEIGVVMLVSAIILLGILLNETNLLNMVWNGILNLLGSLIFGG